MSLYQRQDRRFGRNDLRADLAQLHLPGPSLVIDVRQGSNHPPLLWNLADELDNLGTEMRQFDAYRWRYITDCMALLKLTFFQNPVTDNTALFKLAIKPGQEKELIGMESLIEELGINYINRVRNNRIAAVRDAENGTITPQQPPADPEQSTVQVFFLFDAEDQESMICTGLLAASLKEWYHEYDKSIFPGRESRLKTYALCLSVDAYRHPSEELVDYLEWAPHTVPALDAVILAHTYSDDEAYIRPKLQSYQIELLLYILLLAPEDTRQVNHKLVAGLSVDQNTLEEEDKGQILMPWPIYIAGISSLERSTLHARRYINESQVATALQMLIDQEEVNAQKKVGQIERVVQEKLVRWHEAVKALVASSLSSSAPKAQEIENVVQWITSSLPWSTKKALWLQSFDKCEKKISSLYSSTEDVSFERALNANLLFSLPTSREFRQWLRDGSDNSGDVSSQQSLRLVYQATQMLTELFGGADGMLPRTQQQLTELEAFIATIRIVAEDRPDLLGWQEEIEALASPLRGDINGRWPLFSRKKLRQQYERRFRELCDAVRTHLDKVREIIAAQLILQLLEVAGLYTYNDNSPYRKAITEFEYDLLQAQQDVLERQKKAYERAVIGLEEVEMETTQQLRWLNLKNRRNILDWERIKALAFSENAYISLNLLAEYLLRLIGLQDPLPFTRQYSHTPNTPSSLMYQDILSQPLLFPLETIFTGVLLLSGIIDFDISTLQTLLTRYEDLKKHSHTENSAILESVIPALRHAIQIAKERSQHGYQGAPTIKREQPLVSVLETWMDQQLARDPLFVELFERDDILTYLETNEVPPQQVLAGLRERNRVLGYRDGMNGEDHYYLLLPPGEAGDNFLCGLDLQHSKEINPIWFPDSGMLVFCHMQVSRYVTPSPGSRHWGDDWEGDDEDKDDKNKGKSNQSKGGDPQDIINEAALVAAALAVVGTFVPTADLLGMGAIWIKMTVDLAHNAEHEVNAELAKKALASLGAGVAFYYAGSRLFTLLLHVIPGIGSLTAIGINAALNWIYTQRLGKLLAKEFARSDFDPKMLLTSGLIAVSAILSLPHYSEVHDALNAIGDPHHLAAHAQAATAADAIDPSSTATDATHHATTATDAIDSTSTTAASVHHASTQVDESDFAGPHTSTMLDPGLHGYSIDDLRHHGQRLLRSCGNTLKFGSRIDHLLHAKGTMNVLNADHDAHVQIYQRAISYLPQYKPNLLPAVEEMIKGNTISTKEHMTAFMQGIVHSNMPRKILREVLGDALKFGGGRTQNEA